ncbi:MAG: sugar transferase [Oscillospiraceae bacterium]|nr:sugar transferase [Oscillospiraceae bacterium]
MQPVLSARQYYRAYRRQIRGYATFKRVCDAAIAVVLLVVLSPVLLILAAVCALNTKASPLFTQWRMGRYNTPFKCYKFRTMHPSAPDNVATCKLECAENYISPLGGLLRRLSLDELPQLFNIIKGDMSFIGPRPVVLSETELLNMRVRTRAIIVRPGMTGWAQIHGRDEMEIKDKADYDGYYARRISFKLDCAIFFKSILCVASAKGVREGASPVPAARMEERSA